jgi:hypothetical protein
MLTWFATAESRRFGEELAASIMADLAGVTGKRDAKFTARAEKVLIKAARRVEAFRAREPLNFYKKSKLANAFLWKLKDSGCPPEYAQELTEWLSMWL